MCRLRSATREDARVIAQLHADSWRHAYKDALSDAFLAGDVVADRRDLWARRLSAPSSDQHVVLAELDDRVVGFACAYTNADDTWGALLDNIHVESNAQRRGIGERLMRAVACWVAASTPRAGMFLWVLQSNSNAQTFYSRLGAEKVGADVWAPPGGGAVPRFRFAWRDLEPLLRDRSWGARLDPTAR
jgi:ribosomal protein S18 acetylase RimI-like enzyme